MESKGSWGSKATGKSYKAGYEYLLAYKISVPIYDYTVIFCKRCQSPNYPNFPKLPDDLPKAVNLMITLVNQAIYLQKRLQQSVEEKFVKEGGFRENLFKKRLERKASNKS